MPNVTPKEKKVYDLPDRLVAPAETCAMFGFSKVHLYRLEKAGKFPQRIRITERKVGHMLSTLMRHVEERRINPAPNLAPSRAGSREATAAATAASAQAKVKKRAA